MTLAVFGLSGVLACQQSSDSPDKVTQPRAGRDGFGIIQQNPNPPVVKTAADHAVAFKQPTVVLEKRNRVLMPPKLPRAEGFSQGPAALEAALGIMVDPASNLPAKYGNIGVKINLTPEVVVKVKPLKEVLWVAPPLPESVHIPGAISPVEGKVEVFKKPLEFNRTERQKRATPVPPVFTGDDKHSTLPPWGRVCCAPGLRPGLVAASRARPRVG